MQYMTVCKHQSIAYVSFLFNYKVAVHSNFKSQSPASVKLGSIIFSYMQIPPCSCEVIKITRQQAHEQLSK